MPHILFDNWTFSLDIPEPYKGWMDDYLGGKQHSTDPADLSEHNTMNRGKRSSLHRPTIRAIEELCSLLEGSSDSAAGIQEDNGEAFYYLCEHEYERNGERERTTLAYHARNASLKGCMDSSTKGKVKITPLKSGENDGRAVLFLAAYASMADGAMHDMEFKAKLDEFMEEKKSGFPDPREALSCLMVLCDNLYRRIVNAADLGESGLPIGIPASRNIQMMSDLLIKQGNFQPNAQIFGDFRILTAEKKKKERAATIREIGDEFRLDLALTEEEKEAVPVMDDSMKVSVYAETIAKKVKNTSMRVFMLRGESGTGKTTDCKVIAALLGMPYIAFTCSEGTDELELLSSIIPNTDSAGTGRPEVPGFEDMTMDPATALSMVTGEYREDITAEEAFSVMLDAMYESGCKNAEKAKDFVRVESPLIKGIRGKYLVEIQEPTVIRKEGTLVKLNSLTDDAGTVTLINGETVTKDPDAVIIYTCNPRYRGCRKVNESVLSRMDMVFDTVTPTAEEMTDRALLKTGETDRGKVLEMANCIHEIRRYCHNQSISADVCGNRELIGWVEASIGEESPVDTVKASVISKITDEAELQEEIMEACVVTRFAA